LADIDHLIGLSKAVGMKKPFVDGLDALRKATAWWQEKTDSMDGYHNGNGSSEKERQGVVKERRTVIMKCDKCRKLIEWVEQIDVHFRAAYEIQDLVVRWDIFPMNYLKLLCNRRRREAWDGIEEKSKELAAILEPEKNQCC